MLEQAYQSAERENGLSGFLSVLSRVVPYSSAVWLSVCPDSWLIRPGGHHGCVPGSGFLGPCTEIDPTLSPDTAGGLVPGAARWPNLPSRASSGYHVIDGDDAVPVAFALSVLCSYRGDPIGLLRVLRTKGQQDFSPEEIRSLDRIAGHLGRCTYLQQLAARPDLALPRGFVVFRADVGLLFHSSACERIIGETQPGLDRKLEALQAHDFFFSNSVGIGYRIKPLPLIPDGLLAGVARRLPLRTDVRGKTSPVTTLQALVLEPIRHRTDLRQRLMSYGLTARELEIGLLVVQGFPYKFIAGELSISEQTVKDHLRKVFKKVGVRSGGALVAQILGVKHLRFSAGP